MSTGKLCRGALLLLLSKNMFRVTKTASCYNCTVQN